MIPPEILQKLNDLAIEQHQVQNWRSELWEVKNAKALGIQEAIDSLPSTGGCVFIPPNTTITISRPIYPVDNLLLMGSGSSSIITTDVDNLDLIYAKDISGTPYETAMTTISDLQLVGKATNPGVGIKMERVHNLMIRGLRVTKVSYGIELIASADPSQHTDNNWIIDNYFYQTTGNAIYFHPDAASRGEMNVIRGNEFIEVGGCAILIYPGQLNVIADNVIEKATNHGIYLYNGSRNTITGNVIYGCYKHGIYLLDESYNTISGNALDKNDYDKAGSYDGIYLKDNSDRNTITGNSSIDAGRYGIHIDTADCDKNIILGNIVYANDTGQIQDDGTATVSEHNIVN